MIGHDKNIIESVEKDSNDAEFNMEGGESRANVGSASAENSMDAVKGRVGDSTSYDAEGLEKMDFKQLTEWAMVHGEAKGASDSFKYIVDAMKELNAAAQGSGSKENIKEKMDALTFAVFFYKDTHSANPWSKKGKIRVALCNRLERMAKGNYAEVLSGEENAPKGAEGVAEAVGNSLGMAGGNKIMTSDQMRGLIGKIGVDDGQYSELLNFLDEFHGEADNKMAINGLFIKAGELMGRLKKKALAPLQLLKEQIVNFMRSKSADDYKVLSGKDIFKMSKENKYNDKDNAAGNKLYARENDPIATIYGYFKTTNSSMINKYLRDKKGGLKAATENLIKADGASYAADWEKIINENIQNLSDASKQNELPQNTTLFRMVRKSFIDHSLGIKSEFTPEKMGDIVEQINLRAGTVIQDKGFMSTGFKVDEALMKSGNGNFPIMLKLLCDKGTKCFVTRNYEEGEILLDKGTKYMILSANVKNGASVPAAKYNAGKKGSIFKKQAAVEESFDDNASVDFTGIEIIAKVIQ